MLAEKQKLIMKEGIPVTIKDKYGNNQTTKCLFGRATKQFNNTMSLEYHRRGHFLPSVDIRSGFIVKENISGQSYIVVSTYNEFLDKGFSDTIAHMFKCNATINVGRDVKKADNKGNITVITQNVAENLVVYVQTVRMDLVETKAGLFPDSDYVIYAPGIELTLLDRVSLKIEGKEIPLKVISLDYASYPGLVCIEVKAETRK